MQITYKHNKGPRNGVCYWANRCNVYLLPWLRFCTWFFFSDLLGISIFPLTLCSHITIHVLMYHVMLSLIKPKMWVFTALFLTIVDENLLAIKCSCEQNKLPFFSLCYLPQQWNAKFCGSFSLEESWVEKNFSVFHWYFLKKGANSALLRFQNALPTSLVINCSVSFA